MRLLIESLSGDHYPKESTSISGAYKRGYPTHFRLLNLLRATPWCLCTSKLRPVLNSFR